MGKIENAILYGFDQTYSKSLNTNIGKYFFRLLNKQFPPGHKLSEIFNKNTLKLSHFCIPNLKAKIDEHNKKYSKTHRLQKLNYATV